jgi:N-acetyl-gamma-glutamyl-phosphate/LysW-gamma-L-alpha-aminoadipyl-6-phosphate reductase
MKSYKAAVLGASGFAGAELIRRLIQHPSVELVRVCAADHIGEPVSAAHPHLEGLCELRFENPPPADAVEGVDVVLMGLPHAVSFEVVQSALASNVRVLDLSGAFRLRRSALYEQFYGGPHPHPELLERFVYGLPELNRERIVGARCVASPGCFATTIALGLLAFARAGWLAGSIECVAVTASSGSGSVPSATTHHPVRANNLRTYKPLVHQHTPEIEAVLTDAGGKDLLLNFVPVSAPLVRGIFATSFAHIPADVSVSEVTRVVADAYAHEPFGRVPRARLPAVVAVAGSNYAEVGVTLGPVEGGRRVVVCTSALDNLIKGGAGQAIQNLNLMLGLDERLTLEDPGGFP